MRGAHQRLDGLGVDLAARIHGRDLELRAGLLAQDLPGHDVGVVLEMGDEHLIAGLEQGPRIALRDQIDRFGRAAHEDDLVARARIDEPHQPVARPLIQRRRLLAQGMHAAMNVGVVMAFVVIDRIDDRIRTLRGGAVVQVSERFAVHHAGQHRKFAAHGQHVEGWMLIEHGNVLHRNFRSTCESGNWAISAFSMAARAEGTDMPVSTSARNA